MSLIRYALALVLAVFLRAQSQPAGVFVPPPAPTGGKMQLQAPTALELDAQDARRVVEKQRDQYFRWQEHYRKKAEAAEEEKRAQALDQEVVKLLNELKTKYECLACELDWSMKWIPPQGMTFAARPEQPKYTPSEGCEE